MAPMIEVLDVHRSFGDVHAVRGVSFSIERGQTVGFIGANGAGKTTTMRMMATLDVPDRGRILFNGVDALEKGGYVRDKLGWMPDSYGAYENTTVYEYLDFFSRSYGHKGHDRAERIRQVMEFADLTNLSDRFIDSLSKGMGQRLCLGRALMNDPELLILDEPAAGLDPQARIDFKHLVRLLAKEGKSIFISSHILSELEDMCDILLFIDSGKIVHHGLADSLKREAEGSYLIDVKVSADISRLHERLSVTPGVTIRESIRDGLRVELTDSDRDAVVKLLRTLVKEDFPVFEFHEHTRKLEDAFVAMMEKLRGE
ncbi:MAG: ABC transporter ATP-binding protein [Bdellovibrionota bacterium]